MEFKYTTVTGTIAIEVDEQWVAILEDLDRQEDNNNQTESRRHYHFEACVYEGETFAVEDPAFERLLDSDAAKGRIAPALDKLSKGQREVIDALYYQQLTAKEYADSRGISEAAVSKTRKAALEKLKKFLKNG